MDMQYIYHGGAEQRADRIERGRIAGETVNYGYDSLNRLTSAEATTGGGRPSRTTGSGI